MPHHVMNRDRDDLCIPVCIGCHCRIHSLGRKDGKRVMWQDGMRILTGAFGLDFMKKAEALFRVWPGSEVQDE